MEGASGVAMTKRKSTIALLRALLRSKRMLVSGWLAALVLGSALTLVIPVGVRQMIDHGFSDANATRGVFIGLGLLALFLALATAARLYFVTQLGDQVVGTLRKELFSQLVRRDLRFHEQVAPAELVSRLSTDAEYVRVLVGSSASGALRNLLTLSGSVVMLFVTAPGLAAVTVVAIPLAVAPIVLSMHRVRHLSRESLDRMAAASGVASQALDAIRTVHDFAREDHEDRRYRSAIQHAERALARRSITQAVFAGAAITLIFAVVIGVLWVGAGQVAEGEMTGGTLGQFILFAVIGGMAAIDLVELWGMLQRSLGATSRIAELYDTGMKDVSPAGAWPRTPRGLPIRFDRVGFAYPRRSHDRILDGTSFSIDGGQRVAIVGASGAGKSTLFNLLLGHYRCSSGRILVGGRDIAEIPRDELRQLIAIVSQDPVLFSASVMENIRYGRLDAGDAEVVAAASAANALEFVNALPNGFEEVLGEGGTQLSGGQMQRISIARAILRDAPILLLDEATSALDAITEFKVHQAIETFSRQRTTLMIAHRLSTVAGADSILVLDAGRVAAMGTHEELMRTHADYAHLVKLQQLDAASAFHARSLSARNDFPAPVVSELD